MERADLLSLLASLGRGEVSVEEAAAQLGQNVTVADAVVDYQREARTGIPEVVLGEWKTPQQLIDILAALATTGRGALATRVDEEKAGRVTQGLPNAIHNPKAKTVHVPAASHRPGGGNVAVVAAGTSDLPVVEEAQATAEFLGARVTRIADVGVAGLHRLLERLPAVRAADVVIAIAGMEGALPSVVAGLVEAPVIAVPTSVGYGVGAGGLVALATMLSSCAPGMTVVNIDNGFGAAVTAVKIARLAAEVRARR